MADPVQNPRLSSLARADLAERVCTVLQKTFPDAVPLPILMDARLLGTNLGLDSMDAIQLVMALEQEFVVAIDERELSPDDFETLRAVVLLVERNLQP